MKVKIIIASTAILFIGMVMLISNPIYGQLDSSVTTAVDHDGYVLDHCTPFVDHCVLVCVATLTSLQAVAVVSIQHSYREGKNEGQ